jgi:hypothetical protein
VYFDSSEELPLEFDIDTMTNCCVSYELTYTIMFIAMTLTDPSTSQCLTCQGWSMQLWGSSSTLCMA